MRWIGQAEPPDNVTEHPDGRPLWQVIDEMRDVLAVMAGWDFDSPDEPPPVPPLEELVELVRAKFTETTHAPVADPAGNG